MQRPQPLDLRLQAFEIADAGVIAQRPLVDDIALRIHGPDAALWADDPYVDIGLEGGGGGTALQVQCGLRCGERRLRGHGTGEHQQGGDHDGDPGRRPAATRRHPARHRGYLSAAATCASSSSPTE